MGDLSPRWGVRQTAVSAARAAKEGRERYAGCVPDASDRRPGGQLFPKKTVLPGLNP
jgi:hypothetical protein